MQKLQNKSINNFFLAAKQTQTLQLLLHLFKRKIIKNFNEIKNNIFEVKNVKGFAMFLNLNQFKEIRFF